MKIKMKILSLSPPLSFYAHFTNKQLKMKIQYIAYLDQTRNFISVVVFSLSIQSNFKVIYFPKSFIVVLILVCMEKMILKLLDTRPILVPSHIMLLFLFLSFWSKLTLLFQLQSSIMELFRWMVRRRTI